MSDDDSLKTDDAVEDAKKDEKPAEDAAEESESEDDAADGPEEEESEDDQQPEEKPESGGGATAAGVDQQGRQLYKVKCSKCGNDTEVPFEPSGDRPVYCRDCYMAKKNN